MEMLIILTAIPASLALAFGLQMAALKAILWAIQSRA
jgi:hypothetical protein